MKTKLYLDPDGSIAAKLLAMFLAGMLAAAWWFFARMPGSSIVMVFGAAFMVMALWLEDDWRARFMVTLEISLLTGIMQFGFAMLAQQQWLQLFWMFGFSLLLLWGLSRRMASTVIIGIGMLSIVQPSGFQPGVDRFIDQLLAGGCALSVAALVDIGTATRRIQLTLKDYRRCLALRLQRVTATVPEEARHALDLELLHCSRIANHLLGRQRFLLPRHRAAALKAMNSLCRLHVISRAIVALEDAEAEDLRTLGDEIDRLAEVLRDSSAAVPAPASSLGPVSAASAVRQVIIAELTQLQKEAVD